MDYKLIIKPAIYPRTRYRIVKLLEDEGYDVHGSGTKADMSECDITFSRDSVLDKEK